MKRTACPSIVRILTIKRQCFFTMRHKEHAPMMNSVCGRSRHEVANSRIRYHDSSMCFICEPETVKAKKKKRLKRRNEGLEQRSRIFRRASKPLTKSGPKALNSFLMLPWARVMGTYGRVQRTRKCQKEKRSRSKPFVFVGILPGRDKKSL